MNKQNNKIINIADNRSLYKKIRWCSAPSVIFIAGLGDTFEVWKKVQNQISEVTSTLSYTRAGIGRSSVAAVPKSCHDLVEELSELLHELDAKKPYLLVGHSFGGLIARMYASLYPLDICGMVLVDAAPEYKELAYEKVLPENLIAGNREYLENPSLNSENIDKMQSYKQIVDHSRQTDLPLTIIARGLPDSGEEGWPSQKILEIEQSFQEELQKLSTLSKFRIARRSGHYIHHDEPEIVIEEIILMLKGVEKSLN